MRRVFAVSLILLAAAAMCGAREIVVTNTEDRGAGTLRWAMQTARSGDAITFDPAAFPPSNPATIYPRSELPAITVGGLTIDASNAGVILNGDKITTHEVRGLVLRSDSNTIQGLQIMNFAGSAIVLIGASHNLIGGDREVGTGPVGQGNVLCGSNRGTGVAAWERPSSHNQISGNLIGTDATGMIPCPNMDGVFLVDGAKDNIIGPDNVIAYNHEHGVVIGGSDSLGNTITRNSIHDNAWGGIQLVEGGNAALDSPLMLEFDAGLGVIEGAACPSCTIEVFSGGRQKERFSIDEAGGGVYEGTITADQLGRFILTKGAEFTGSELTATATDSRGNTSGFAAPISATQGSLSLQANETGAAVHMHTKPSVELQDNRIGEMGCLYDQVSSFAELGQFIRNRIALGMTWLRLGVDSYDWPEVVEWGGFSRDSVDPKDDAAINELIRNEIMLMLVLVYWDPQISTTSPPERRFSTDEEVERYLAYAGRIAEHFKGRVTHYEILNEPDVREPGQFVDVNDYIELVRQTIPVIRAADPAARVVAGAITPLHYPPSYEYLFHILRSDIIASVDGISWHIDQASPEFLRDYYYRYPEIVRDIRDTATANGFVGELFTEELRFLTPQTPHPTEPFFYREIPSAKYHARGLVMNLGLDLTTGVALEGSDDQPVLARVLQNLCTVMAGHESIDMPVEIGIETDGPVAYCAFRYSNGDRILAVWTDGIAQDEDPGIPATITFPDLAAGTIAGIDVLHGFEQELVFEIGGGDTIVRDLLVKDYPILIRLSDITFGSDYEETVGDGFHRIGDIDNVGGDADRDGDGVLDDIDFCPDWPGSPETSGC